MRLSRSFAKLVKYLNVKFLKTRLRSFVKRVRTCFAGLEFIFSTILSLFGRTRAWKWRIFAFPRWIFMRSAESFCQKIKTLRSARVHDLNTWSRRMNMFSFLSYNDINGKFPRFVLLMKKEIKQWCGHDKGILNNDEGKKADLIIILGWTLFLAEAIITSWSLNLNYESHSKRFDFKHAIIFHVRMELMSKC